MSGVFLSPSPPDIPPELYKKAELNNEDLTREERILLLKRLDIFGLALAFPDRLTPAQFNVIVLRPPPDVLRANIRAATNNEMETPAELYAACEAGTATFAMADLAFNLFKDPNITPMTQVMEARDAAGFRAVARQRPGEYAVIAAAVNLIMRRENLGAGYTAMARLRTGPEMRAMARQRTFRIHDEEAKRPREELDRQLVKELAALEKENEELALMAKRWRSEIEEMLKTEEREVARGH